MVVSRVKFLTRWMPGCRSEAARHKRRRRTVYSRVPRVKRVRLGSRSEPEVRQMFRRRLGRDERHRSFLAEGREGTLFPMPNLNVIAES